MPGTSSETLRHRRQPRYSVPLVLRRACSIGGGNWREEARRTFLFPAWDRA